MLIEDGFYKGGSVVSLRKDVVRIQKQQHESGDNDTFGQLTFLSSVITIGVGGGGTPIGG